ncbi:MAG: hypothetical protein SGI83_17900 [Bacteroidota bacterium]|nr:hypothetical protein [Bacteroidota bacterium]
MMYYQLYQYLIQHKELPVPGIGTFLLERKPAEMDFPNRTIHPPSYAVALQPASYVPGRIFFSWLAQSLGITDREAIFRFNDFAFDMKRQISDGTVINWNGVGTLNRGLSGDVKFTAISSAGNLLSPVTAEKVIRKKAEHMVRVGEDQKTSAEMTEMLNQTEEKRSYWWAFPLAAGLLAIMFIGWYFSEHGVDMAATANREKLSPTEAVTTYQLLP